jgi:arylsulfatase A-like enzyme
MTRRTAVCPEAGPIGSSAQKLAANRPGVLTLLVLSAWCGLVAGLLEVGAIILRKRTFDLNQLYWMSRHFIWLIPLINLAIFLVVGLALSLLVRCAPRRGSWIAPRVLFGLTLLPMFLAAFPQIYGLAWLMVVLGLAARSVPVFQRHGARLRRLVCVSFPIVAGVVPILAASLWATARLKAWREEVKPLPQAGSPNILLIVLDTVGASHLSLHGYDRPTSPTMDELAPRAIRFDRVQATSSWTLPSHASMFTGRWPHELSAGWFTPLDGVFPTLAEFLGSHGYATAGFVANSWYCASDSGLARGFTVYRDHAFPRLTAFKTAVLVDRSMEWMQAMERFLENWLDFELLRPAVDYLWWLFKANRKETAGVNREFLDWLSGRGQPERPFFAFLNFYDAHYPYEVPESGIHRFGVRQRSPREATVMRDWLQLVQKGPSEGQIRLARDSYDDCVAALDEQLGRLIDELEHRAVLERTWVIITADHGESFGEHPGVYWHGTSLYQTQLLVPLLIIPPPGGPLPRVVAETASLRDLASTIVDVLGFKVGSPFPGESLARFWNRRAAPAPALAASDQALSEVVPLGAFDPDPSQWLQKPRWPMAALTSGDWTYIRHEGDVREELFHTRADNQERHNLAGEPAMQPTVERMRAALDRLTAGRLTPQRFNP